jgi:hypothetical protein
MSVMGKHDKNKKVKRKKNSEISVVPQIIGQEAFYDSVIKSKSNKTKTKDTDSIYSTPGHSVFIPIYPTDRKEDIDNKLKLLSFAKEIIYNSKSFYEISLEIGALDHKCLLLHLHDPEKTHHYFENTSLSGEPNFSSLLKSSAKKSFCEFKKLSNLFPKNIMLSSKDWESFYYAVASGYIVDMLYLYSRSTQSTWKDIMMFFFVAYSSAVFTLPKYKKHSNNSPRSKDHENRCRLIKKISTSGKKHGDIRPSIKYMAEAFYNFTKYLIHISQNHRSLNEPKPTKFFIDDCKFIASKDETTRKNMFRKYLSDFPLEKECLINRSSTQSHGVLELYKDMTNKK